MPELLQAIRLPLISMKYIVENIEKENLVTSNSKCKIYSNTTLIIIHIISGKIKIVSTCYDLHALDFVTCIDNTHMVFDLL